MSSGNGLNESSCVIVHSSNLVDQGLNESSCVIVHSSNLVDQGLNESSCVIIHSSNLVDQGLKGLSNSSTGIFHSRTLSSISKKKQQSVCKTGHPPHAALPQSL